MAKIAARNANGLWRRTQDDGDDDAEQQESGAMVEHPEANEGRGSAAIRPALRNPMNVSSSPMPPAAATRSPAGIAIATRSRSGVAETSRNSTPAQNTIPSAVCHGTWFCRMIV